MTRLHDDKGSEELFALFPHNLLNRLG